MTENQLDIPLNQTQGEKKPVTFLFRYWFGPGDTTYIETIGSDGNSYGFKGENMMPIDVSGHESIEQRSSRFRGPPLDTGIKSSLLFLSLAVGVLSVLLSILSWML